MEKTRKMPVMSKIVPFSNQAKQPAEVTPNHHLEKFTRHLGEAPVSRHYARWLEEIHHPA